MKKSIYLLVAVALVFSLVFIANGKKPKEEEAPMEETAEMAAPSMDHSNLDEFVYPRHFRGSAHVAAESVFYAVDFIAPVNMGIKLEDVYGAKFFESFVHGDGYRIIASKNNWN